MKNLRFIKSLVPVSLLERQKIRFANFQNYPVVLVYQMSIGEYYYSSTHMRQSLFYKICKTFLF